jgi:hypothetical protein
MPIQPAQHAADISTDLPPDMAARQLVELLRDLAKKPVIQAHTGSINLGSRTAYRLLGGLLQAGRKRIPMVVTWSIASEGAGSSVRLKMTSEEGSYLVATRAHYAVYHERFTRLEHDIETSLT